MTTFETIEDLDIHGVLSLIIDNAMPFRFERSEDETVLIIGPEDDKVLVTFNSNAISHMEEV